MTFTRDGCMILWDGKPFAVLNTEGSAEWLLSVLCEQPIRIVLLPPQPLPH